MYSLVENWTLYCPYRLQKSDCVINRKTRYIPTCMHFYRSHLVENPKGTIPRTAAYTLQYLDQSIERQANYPDKHFFSREVPVNYGLLPGCD